MQIQSSIKRFSKDLLHYITGWHAEEKGYFKEEKDENNLELLLQNNFSRVFNKIFTERNIYYGLGKALPNITLWGGLSALYIFRDFPGSELFLLSFACGETIRASIEIMYHTRSKIKPFKLKRALQPEAIENDYKFVSNAWRGPMSRLDYPDNPDNKINPFTNN